MGRLGGNGIELYNGSPKYVTTIASTAASSVNAEAFPTGAVLLLIPSAACNIMAGTANTVVTAANGVPLAAGEKFYLTLTNSQTHIAAIGAASIQIFELR